MKLPIAIPVLGFLCAALAPADILRVGAGQTHATIQAAVDAAAPGDTIEVLPGTYAENVTVTQSPLTLLGAQHATDARGRVTGVPNPATESVVAPASGDAITLASGDGAIVVSGFALVASPALGAGVVRTGATPLPGLVLSNNHIEVRAGAAGAALLLDQNAEDATVSACVFLASAAAPQAVALVGGSSFDGLRFTDNHVLRDGGTPTGAGLAVDGNRNMGASAVRTPSIQGNRFSGHATGFAAGARSLANATVADNIFSGNLEGMAGGPRDCSLVNNEWSGNTQHGLRLTAAGEITDATYGARQNTLEDNRFSGNGSADLLCEAQAPGTLDTNVVSDNRFGSASAVINQDPSAVLSAARNYWDAPDGPGGAAAGGGGTITANVIYLPYFTDSNLTNLFYGTGSLAGDVTIGDGETITADSLTVASGSALRVLEGGRLEVAELILPGGGSLVIRGGTALIGKLDMQPGAVLEAVDGDLLLDPAEDGNYHTISGSFTFFNCLGSLWINGNTSFSGDTLGLVSDIHVAPGSVMQVLGALTLDGCRIDCAGTFSLLVNYGAAFTMARCEVKGAAISLVGSAVTLRDNQFTGSSVTVFSTVNGGRIYHNVFGGGLGLLSILPGAVVTTTVEGWSNVASLSQVRNELFLGFRPPLDPTRTLDAAGNLFVQPGDFVDTGLEIAKLNATTQAVEALVGFSTDYLTFSSLLPSAAWSNGLYQTSDESAVVGKLNTAVGLTFSTLDPDGTTAAGAVADLRMVAKPHEGLTRMFFRAKAASDHPLIDTRLTASTNDTPYFKEYPFTRNTPVLTVDGTLPVFAPGGSAVQTQQGNPVDVLADGVLTRMGTVTVAFEVMDELAGIDDGEVWAELSGPGGTFNGILTGTAVVDIDGVAYTRHTFTFAITPATPDGLYDVNGTAMDRSGNVGVLALGTLEVAKNRITATVQPQGLVTTPLTRDVVFTASDGGGAVLATWTVPVAFAGGLGSTVLERVPDGTLFLSAKMAWNLRVRLPVTLGPDGSGTNSFTGASVLPGGDFTDDNRVTLADYNLLRANFSTVSGLADITGNGVVNVGDYNILRANWFTIGAPL